MADNKSKGVGEIAPVNEVEAVEVADTTVAPPRSAIELMGDITEAVGKWRAIKDQIGALETLVTEYRRELGNAHGIHITLDDFDSGRSVNEPARVGSMTPPVSDAPARVEPALDTTGIPVESIRRDAFPPEDVRSSDAHDFATNLAGAFDRAVQVGMGTNVSDRRGRYGEFDINVGTRGR